MTPLVPERTEPPALDGYVDGPVDGSSVPRTGLVVWGWHSWAGVPVAAVAVEAEGVRVVVTPGEVPRPDVAEALGQPGLVHSGWRAVLDLAAAPDRGPDDAVIAITVWGSPDASPVRLAPIRVALLDEEERPPPPEPPPPPAIVGDLNRPAEGEVVDGSVQVAGWAISEVTALSRVEIIVNDRDFGPARLGVSRMDLAPVFPEPHAVISGFEHVVDLSDLPPGLARIVVRAWAGSVGPVDVVDRWFELAPPGPAPSAARRSNGAGDERRATLSARRGRLVEEGDGRSGGGLNLAVLTHSLQLGGAELWLKELLRQSGAGRSFPCRVLSLAGGPLVDDLEAAGIEVHVAEGQPPSDVESYEGRVTDVAMWLAAGGHNAALVNTVLPWHGVDAAADLGLPVVWAIHESWRPGELWEALYAARVVPEVRATFTPALRRAGALVFVAEATRRLYVGPAEADRTAVVPYGIDLDEVDAYCRRMTHEAARAALGVDAETKMVLVMGVVQPRKAQTVIAAAFAEVVDDFPHALLAIVGDIGGPYGEALVEYLRRRGLGERTRVVPVTSDTFVWYRAADAFVCGSDVESMPRSILEALAFGLPVAATSVFGIPDLLTDGKTGYLFAARDKDATVEGLRRLLGADPVEADRVGAAGRRLASDSLGSSGYAREVMALLEGLRSDPEARPADILARVSARPSS